jgi:hypothetical protein
VTQKTPSPLQSCLISLAGFGFMIVSCFGAVIAGDKGAGEPLVYLLMLAVLVGFGFWMISGVMFFYRLSQRRQSPAPKE